MSEPKQRIPPDYLQVLVHFYRGEVQRSTEWRTRLDLTTNWAIIATTAAFSWVFAADTTTDNHIVLIFMTHLIFLLMCIEARRYRYYDLWHTRVRMLEVHLLVPALNPELDILQGNWRQVLSNDLLLPAYKISFLEALARRLQSNYIWVFLGLLVGWLLRVYTQARTPEDDIPTLESFYEACGYGDRIPPAAVIGAQALFWLVLFLIYATTWRTRYVTGEIRRRDPKAKQWPI